MGLRLAVRVPRRRASARWFRKAIQCATASGGTRPGSAWGGKSMPGSAGRVAGGELNWRVVAGGPRPPAREASAATRWRQRTRWVSAAHWRAAVCSTRTTTATAAQAHLRMRLLSSAWVKRGRMKARRHLRAALSGHRGASGRPPSIHLVAMGGEGGGDGGEVGGREVGVGQRREIAQSSMVGWCWGVLRRCPGAVFECGMCPSIVAQDVQR